MDLQRYSFKIITSTLTTLIHIRKKTNRHESFKWYYWYLPKKNYGPLTVRQ